MSALELALQRSKYKHLNDDEWRWFLQQAEGRERTADKLPTFASIEDWWYPVRLSCEQCSSELTAKYKASLVKEVMGYGLPVTGDKRLFVDLTAGYGVDTYFLSEYFTDTDYVEQNAELCRIAEHNFAIHNSQFKIHNTTAEEFLTRTPSTTPCKRYDLIYLDPARRDSHGGKVFRLEDCTPNLIELLPTLHAHLAPEGRIMLKLSPMLDITQAVKELSAVSIQWSVYVVAVKNEVKEVLLLSQEPRAESREPRDERRETRAESRETRAESREPRAESRELDITAIDLAEPEKAFVFTREEEQKCILINGGNGENGGFLYEPNAAILKAGAYKLIAQRYGLSKLDVNTHLYASDRLVDNFPGRVWQIAESQELRAKSQANVLTRNYPLTPEQLKKKLHLRDGGTAFVIGCRVAGKPTLFLAERI